jgi:phage tail P2-like protein
MKFDDLEFIKLLPKFMREDATDKALANAVGSVLSSVFENTDTIRVWDQFEQLNEKQCDELAWELDVDWYDSDGMTLDEKQQTLKYASSVKMKRGTKQAIEQLLNTYFGEGEGFVEEWYQYDGLPFTFRALIENTETDPESYEKFMSVIDAAKNERSILERLYVLWRQGLDDGYAVETGMNSKLAKYEFTKCGTVSRPATVGFKVLGTAETEPDINQVEYKIEQTGKTICGTGTVPATVGFKVLGTAETEPDINQVEYKIEQTGKTICGTGTVPGTVGQATKTTVTAANTLIATSYSFIHAGTRRCGQ